MSYLRLANIERGLSINFHANRLADGIQCSGSVSVGHLFVGLASL